MQRKVVDAFASAPHRMPDTSRLELLSDRERDVLALVGEGLSNQEIAERLYMSPLTAKTHVSRILQKFGARDRAQLVVIAFQTGLASL